MTENEMRSLLSAVPKAVVGGLPVAALGRAETADLLIRTALSRSRIFAPPLFTSANGEVLSLCSRSKEIDQLFQDAGLVSADGEPLVIASRLLSRRPLPERVATTDLFHDIASRAVPLQMSSVFYGATESEANKAVDKIKQLYPGFQILRHYHGYRNEAEQGKIVGEIARLKPDILWLCLGAPREQKFYYKWRSRLATVGVVKTGGGLLNFLSGTRSRAPLLIQRIGLEWLYRLLLEPRRLFWRYASTNPHSIMLLLTRTR